MFVKYLKSELYRASGMKSTYILLGCMLIVVLITTFMFTKIDYSSFISASDDDLQEINDAGFSLDAMDTGIEAGKETSVNMYVYTEGSSEGDPVDVQLYGNGMYRDASLPELFQESAKVMYDALMCVIFISLFLGGAYKAGYDKNLIVANGNRSILFLSRFCVIAFYDLVMLIMMLISTLIADVMFTGSVSMTSDGSFLRYIIVSYILLLAFSSVVMAVTIVTRSAAAGNTVGIFLCIGTVSMVCAVVDYILIKYLGFPGTFRIADITLSQNMTVLNLNSDNSIYTRAVICSLVYLIASVISSFVVIEKRDIN